MTVKINTEKMASCSCTLITIKLINRHHKIKCLVHFIMASKKKKKKEIKSEVVCEKRPQEVPYDFMCHMEGYVLGFFTVRICKLHPIGQTCPAA